ncbi:MAG TPA: CBS domain-containing protein [Egibacteraceae bacterium]|nr:CBS domain-containing protein [Egibacteraceae bacterium]
MPRDLPVTQVMSRDVLTVRPQDSLEDVVRLLAGRNISGAPVVDADGMLTGLLDDSDLLVADARLHAPTVVELFGAYLTMPGEQRRYEEELRHALARTVGDVMRTPSPSVTDEALVEDVATIMVEKGVSRVPVIDHTGRVVGIVTRGDLVAAMGR